MKRRILCFLLAALLLTGSVSASAGSQSDPLITVSYITDTFLPQLRRAFSALLQTLIGEPGTVTMTLGAGQSLRLTEGQQITLISGSASLSLSGGQAVDASAGEALTGTLTLLPGHRHILCRGAKASVDIQSESVVKTSYPVALGDGCPFRDVQRGDWFYNDVAQAYRRGLVNGLDEVTYAPRGTLTAAQCVKLAACMHQLRETGSVTLSNSPSGPWYRSYVDYALAAGILTGEFEDYDAVIQRRRFVELFYRALPAGSYEVINRIPDGAIPDVGMQDPGAAEIYAFYRAGILTGYAADETHAEHAFDAGSTITRAEVATIMNRMFEPEARRQFNI